MVAKMQIHCCYCSATFLTHPHSCELVAVLAAPNLWQSFVYFMRTMGNFDM
jgi:hypothetical protein